ncbi:MAG: 7-cyano-7-deazaguanine synthase QueC [Planctomycetota bacterium]
MTTGQEAKKLAVVLLSGGLDSATTLAVAKRDGFTCHALSFDYGQRHAVELEAARAVAESLGVASHRTAKIDLRAFGGSALTDDALDVPKDRDDDAMSADIPITYVPARNTIFLSYALALAEVLGSTDLFIGVNAVDYSGYPDCRPEFIAAFQDMANLATKAGVTTTNGDHLRIHTPLIDLPKPDIIRLGLDLGVDYGLTHSCYDPLPPDFVKPCGRCDSCLIRMRAFEQLGIPDPAMVRHHGGASAT